MTGKFVRNSSGQVNFIESSFQKRASRWTPYRFCESQRDGNYKYHFRYGPLKKNTSEQSRIKYEDNAYTNSLAYTDIEIHCFCINSDHDFYSPALLESELLTAYLKNKGNLPPANNSL